jgi:hypothetical protein
MRSSAESNTTSATEFSQRESPTISTSRPCFKYLDILIFAPRSYALLLHRGWHRSERMQFNEGKACDAVLRHLEAREGTARSKIRWPEEEHHAGPVELVCNIGSALYALEHTGIEPFEGLVQLNQEAERVFGPIEAAVSAVVPDGEVWRLSLPALGLQGRSGREVRQAREALIDFIKNTAPTLQRRPTPTIEVRRR